MIEEKHPLPQKIIIIDDNVNIHKDFIKILTPNKPNKQSKLEEDLFGSPSEPHVDFPEFEIHTATQGLEGIEKIAEAASSNRPFSIAFVDVRMPPGLDGIETIKRIYPIDPHIQIVICSAFSDYTWEQTADNLGLRENLLILKKPFDSIAVKQLVCSLAKKSSLLSQLRKETRTLEGMLLNKDIKLKESMSLAQATLDSTNDGILIVDPKGSIVGFNSHFCDIWNMTKSLLKTNDRNLIINFGLQQLTNPEAFMKKFKELNENKEATSSVILYFKNGKVIEQITSPHFLDGKIVGRIFTYRDISEKTRLTEKLAHQATHDALTNLPNRLLLHDRLNLAINHASRHNTKIGVFFLDLDKFKLINDSLSHDVGDEVLKAISERVNRNLRSEDTLARLGGDEFVIITPGVFKQENILAIAKHLESIFQEPFQVSNHLLNMTCSIGIAVYPEDGETPEQLLRNADLAMYSSKQKGKNQYQFYVEKLNLDALNKFQIESELRNALANHEFILHYQPQYNVNTNAIVGVEALLRWAHPVHGIINPNDFLPQAKESGLIIPIGEWALRTACMQNKKWQEEGLLQARIAVNVSTEQLKVTLFVDTVKKILEETQLSPKLLELELTETADLSDSDVIHKLQELRKMDIHIALDDFGTGDSSFRYLRNSNIDRIKIDQSFVKNIQIDSTDEVMIQAILSIAKSMNLNVVAEGVETSNQLLFLKEIACQDIQGFYYSKPLDSEQFDNLLKNKSTL